MSFLKLVNIRKISSKGETSQHTKFSDSSESSESFKSVDFAFKEHAGPLSWMGAKEKHIEYISMNRDCIWSEVPEAILLDFVAAGQREWFKNSESAVKLLACNWVNTLSSGNAVEIELPDSFGRSYFFKIKAFEDSIMNEMIPESMKVFADGFEEMTIEIVMEISEDNAKKKGVASGGGLYELEIVVSEKKFIEDVNKYNNDIKMAGRCWVNELDFNAFKLPLAEKDILKPVIGWSYVAAQVERAFERDGCYNPSEFSVIATLAALSRLVNDLMEEQTLELNAMINHLFKEEVPVLIGKSVLIECFNSKLFLNDFK